MDGLKPCPFCGQSVIMKREPLWNGSHGYPGCYQYTVSCSNIDCRCSIYLGSNDTIYRSDEEAMAEAERRWNRRAGEDES